MNTLARTTLMLLALSSGALAAIVGDPRPSRAADEVAPVELAEWIRDRRPGLLVLDARTAPSIERDRLPGARPLAGVDAAVMSASAIVVVYADKRVDDATLEALRRRASPHRVLRLHGGVAAWNTDVLFPTIRADASAAQQREFVPRARLSRYFGGAPRVLEPGTSANRARSRLGC